MRGVLHIVPLDLAERPDVQPFFERAMADVIARAELSTLRAAQFDAYLEEQDS